MQPNQPRSPFSRHVIQVRAAGLSSRLAFVRRNLWYRLWSADIFGLRGAPESHHAGMRAFWADSLLATLSDSFYVTYVSLYVLALGGTRSQVGWLTSISSLLGMLAPLPGAALTQRLGQRRRMVVIFSICFRVMLLLAALVPFLFTGTTAALVIVLLFALRAGFMNLFTPAWLSLTRDIVPLPSRGHYLASRNMMTALVSMLAVPIAGYLIDRAGAPAGYQWALGISFVVGIAASYAFGQIPEPRQQGAAPVGVLNQVRSFWHALTGNRVFLAFVGIRLLWDLAVQIGGPYFTVYQVEVLESSPQVIGLLATATAVARMVGLRLWGRWMDRKGARWTTTLSTLVVPILPLMWVFASRPWHIIFPSIGTGLLWAGFEIGSFALLLELLEGEDSTQAAAGYTTLLSAAGIVGPLIGGWLIDLAGYHWDFILSAVLRLTAGLLFMGLLKPFSFRRKRLSTAKARPLS